MNRQAKGRAAAIVASITLIAGTVALGTVVKGHTARRVTTAGPPPAAPAPEPPTATVAPADAGAFPGFWPQATREGAVALQAAVDQGHQPWRLDPAAIAEAFAQDFAGWRIHVDSAEVSGSAGAGWTATVVFRPYVGEPGHLAPGAHQRHVLRLVGLAGAARPAWFVSSLASDNIVVATPVAGEAVSSPVRMETTAGAYENTVLAEVRDDNGTRLSPPGGSSVLQVLGEAGGGRARLAIGLPFAAPQTPSGIVVLSAGTGAGPTPDMSVVRVRFAAGAAGMAPGGAGCCGLSHVRVGTHLGFDRITFEFLSGALPGYRVEPVTAPFQEDASGRLVEVSGRRHLKIVFQSSTVDLAGQRTYAGPSDFRPGYPALAEARLAGDFEQVLTWILGLNGSGAWHTTELSSPTRLVLDVEH